MWFLTMLAPPLAQEAGHPSGRKSWEARKLECDAWHLRRLQVPFTLVPCLFWGYSGSSRSQLLGVAESGPRGAHGGWARLRLVFVANDVKTTTIRAVAWHPTRVVDSRGETRGSTWIVSPLC